MTEPGELVDVLMMLCFIYIKWLHQIDQYLVSRIADMSNKLKLLLCVLFWIYVPLRNYEW